MTTELIAGKSMIGHLGDAPGTVATFKRDQVDIRMISVLGSSPDGYHCYQIGVRVDAPEFKSSKEALKWLDGKVVATPKGSCTDRFFQDVLQREGVKPKEYLNQPIGVITTNVRAKKIDGFATWEPQGAQVSTLVGEGSARIVSTGYPWGERDAGFVICRKDFMDQNPEAVKAWLKCEIEAQMWYYDPRNHAEVLRLVQKHMKGISHKAMWFSMCGLIPAPYYGGPIREEKPFVMNDDIRKLCDKVVKYLFKEKIVQAGEYLPGAIDDSLARETMKEMGVSSPLTRLKAVPLEKGYPLLTAGKTEEYAALFKL